MTDAFAGDADKLSANVMLRADYSDGLDVAGPQFETIRDVLAGLEVGRIVLDAEKAEDGSEE